MSLVYFTKNWPVRNVDSLRQRTVSLVETLCNANKKIVLCSPDLNINARQQLSQYPLTLHDINPRKVNSSLNLTRYSPQYFIFDSVETEQMFSGILYNKWNKVPRILDLNRLQNLEHWRKMNYSLFPNQINPKNGLMAPTENQSIFTLSEMRSINRSDYVISCNQFISYLVKHNLKKSESSYISFGFPMMEFLASISNLEYRPFKNREDFVFFGNFQNESNIQSLNCLIQSIWPLIRKQLPKVKLFVYGAGRDKNFYSKKSSLKDQGIILSGEMDDSQDLSNYKALLFPNLASTGIRVKIREAWYNHLPVVTTPTGAQGLFMESVDPFLDSSKNKKGNSFASERELLEEQKQGQNTISEYYRLRKMNANDDMLTFGGSFSNYTFSDFANSAVKLYNDQQHWKKCLSKGHNYLFSRQNDFQLIKNMKSVLVKSEVSAYEGRKKNEYIEEWRRYTKSGEFMKMIGK